MRGFVTNSLTFQCVRCSGAEKHAARLPSKFPADSPGSFAKKPAECFAAKAFTVKQIRRENAARSASQEEHMNPVIRKMREDDFDMLYALLSDPAVMAYLEPPYGEEQTRRFLESAGLSEPPLICAAEDDGKFIGYVILHGYDEHSMEAGWVLLPEFWGRGYASALTDLLIAEAERKEKDLVIECSPDQTATKHIAAKKGFTYRGCDGGLEIYRLDLRKADTDHAE